MQSDALFNINGYYLTDKEVIANVICRENCVYDGGVFVDSKVKPYMKKDFAVVCDELEALGTEIGVAIRCQREEIFEKMHRL